MLSDIFERIDSLAASASLLDAPGFTEARVARMIVAWAQKLPQPLPLVGDDSRLVDPWLGKYHGHGHNQASRDISCYFCRDIGVSGRGHLYLDRAIILSDEFVPNYWRQIITDTGGIDIDNEFSLPQRVIEEPTLVVSGHGVDVYGHFLIETLPKIMVARRALGGDIGSLRVLLEIGTPLWLLRILSDVLELDAEQFVVYDPLQERILLRQAVMPTLASFDGWFHPFCNLAIEETIRLAGVEPNSIDVPRLFLSRALFFNPATEVRRCTNELRLAEIAAKEFGFALIAPESFPWRTQLGLFRNAKIVVGEFGSGLHSTLFSRPGTVVGSIGLASMGQSMIGALRQQHNAYLRTERDEDGSYVIDEDLFRLFLMQIVAAAGRL